MGILSLNHGLQMKLIIGILQHANTQTRKKIMVSIVGTMALLLQSLQLQAKVKRHLPVNPAVKQKLKKFGLQQKQVGAKLLIQVNL